MLKKFDKKCHVYISTSYVLAKLFHEEATSFVTCVKRIKFGAQKLFTRHIFYLFSRGQKHISLLQTRCAHIECRDVHAKFLFQLFPIIDADFMPMGVAVRSIPSVGCGDHMHSIY
jgi:hypothetical protein